MLTYRLGIQYKYKDSAPRIGDFVHVILANLYRGKTIDEACAAIESLVDEHLTLIEVEVATGNLLINGDSPENATRYLIEDAMLARAMACIFWRKYPLEGDWEIVAVEQTIVLPDGCKGIIDLLLRSKTDSKLWIVDHKTTSENPVDLCRSFSYDHQTNLYSSLVYASYGEPVEGFIHNVIQKPTIRYSPYTLDKLASRNDYPEAIKKKLVNQHPLTQNQAVTKAHIDALIEHDSRYLNPYEKYLSRVDQWYEGHFTTDPANPPMVRSFVRYAPTLLDNMEWSNRLGRMMDASGRQLRGPLVIASSREFAEYEEELPRFPRNPSSCRGCKFTGFCSSVPELWPDLVATGPFTLKGDSHDHPNPD